MATNYIGEAARIIYVSRRKSEAGSQTVRPAPTAVGGTIYANSEFEGCECFQRRKALYLLDTGFNTNGHEF